MTATLTDRYVHAVTSSLREKQRPDIDRELRAAIADDTEARIQAGADAAAAERDTITALGDPDRLAAGYADRPLHLIGPAYYLDWWRLLKLLMIIVVPIVFAVVLTVQLFTTQSVGGAFGAAWAITISLIVHLAFWTTLVFAIIERSAGTRPKPLTAWSPDLLPEPEGSRVGIVETVIGTVWLLFLAGAIVWQHLTSLFHTPSGEPIPMLHPQLWSLWIPLLFVVLALQLGMLWLDYARGRQSWAGASIGGVLAAAFWGGILWLLNTGQLLNPAFLDAAGVDVEATRGILLGISVLVAGIGIWVVIDGFRRTWRLRKV